MFADSKVGIFDEDRFGCYSTAHSTDTIADVNEGILENGRIKVRAEHSGNFHWHSVHNHS